LPWGADNGCEAKAFGAGDCGCEEKAFGAEDCGCEEKAFGAGDCGCEEKAFGADGAASCIAETKGEPKGIAGAVAAMSEGVEAFCCEAGVKKVVMDA
jgi:hypothetical protein